jgi:hypothetical protein
LATQRQDSCLGQDDRPLRLGRLRTDELERAVQPLQSVANAEVPGIQVDVLPGKTEQLSLSQASRQRYDEERLPRMPAYVLKERTGLLGSEGFDL